MIISGIFFLSFCIGLLLFFILLKFNAKSNYANKILAFYVLLLALFSLHNLLTSSGYIYQIPYFFRITKPLSFLVAPLIYLYIRGSLFQEKGFKKKDFWHFLPAILHLIELLPFYFVSKEIKLQQLTRFMKDMNSGMQANEGLTPNYINEFLLYFLILVYLVAGYRLLRKEKASFSYPKTDNNIIVFKWLKVFWLLNFSYIFILIITFLGLFMQLKANVFLIKTIENAVALLIIGISLLFRPEIIYGFKKSIYYVFEENKETKNRYSTPKINTVRLKEYNDALAACITDQKPFLKHGLTLNELANMSTIPYTYLSEFINIEKQMNFSTYINFLRVEYSKELLELPENKKYTLDSIAEQAGFSSFTSFRRSFLKFQNCTPTEYLNRLKK